MKTEDHTQWVGAIVTNLQALETVLRYFLLRLHKQDASFPNVGDADASETYLTKYVSLGPLVNEFNAALIADEKKFALDTKAVTIRDALAHGHLLTTDELPARLWKFGKSKNGRVPVDSCDELTVDWLKATSNMIAAQKKKVVDCFTTRGYQGLRQPDRRVERQPSTARASHPASVIRTLATSTNLPARGGMFLWAVGPFELTNSGEIYKQIAFVSRRRVRHQSGKRGFRGTEGRNDAATDRF